MLFFLKKKFLLKTYGVVHEIFVGIRFAFIIYYDIRDSMRANIHLRNVIYPDSGGRMDIKYSPISWVVKVNY